MKITRQARLSKVAELEINQKQKEKDILGMLANNETLKVIKFLEIYTNYLIEQMDQLNTYDFSCEGVCVFPKSLWSIPGKILKY